MTAIPGSTEVNRGEGRHDHHENDEQSRDDETRLAPQLLPGVAPETGRLARLRRLSGTTSGVTTSGARISVGVLLVVSVIPDPRIEHGIHDVDHQIGDADDHERATIPPPPRLPRVAW